MDPALNAWLSVLGELSHYDVLGVPRSASYDEVRRAFRAFAQTFHPDAHRTREAEERRAVERIFHRGIEAERTLCHAALRAAYDDALAGTGEGRGSLPIPAASRPPSREARSSWPGPLRLGDAVRTPTARPFAHRAEELVQRGDLRQAKLQVLMAMHVDPNNPTLEAYAASIEARLAEAPTPPKVPG